MFPVLCAPRNIHTTELSSFSSQYLCACARDLSLLLFLCLVILSNANKREKPRFQGCSPVQASFLTVYSQRTRGEVKCSQHKAGSDMAAALTVPEQSHPGPRFGFLGQHVALGSDVLVQNCTRTADADSREVFVPYQSLSSFPLQSGTKDLGLGPVHEPPRTYQVSFVLTESQAA